MKRFLVCLIFVVSMPVCAMNNGVATNLGQVVQRKYVNGTVIYNLYPKIVDGKGPYTCSTLSYELPMSCRKFTCERLDVLEMETIQRYPSNQSEMIFKVVEFEYLLATSQIEQHNGIYKFMHESKTFYFTKKDEKITCGSFDPDANTRNIPSDYLDAFVYRTDSSVLAAGTLAYDQVFSSLEMDYKKTSE